MFFIGAQFSNLYCTPAKKRIAGLDFRERVCCVLVLNSVPSTPAKKRIAGLDFRANKRIARVNFYTSGQITRLHAYTRIARLHFGAN